jgi:transposase, IS5 family
VNSLADWGLRESYKKLEKSNNRLLKISGLIDWISIRHDLEGMYDNKSEKGGRPNCDVILMFKILLLQQWYGLSDLEVERLIADRMSFMGFLGFQIQFQIPEPSGYLEIGWKRRERINQCGLNFKDS